MSWSQFFRVVTVAPSDMVLTASKKMLELKVSSAVVAIENKPGGILTWVPFLSLITGTTISRPDSNYKPCFDLYDRSRDILMRVIAQNLPPESTTVEKASLFTITFVSLCNHI
jgi:hypothetical protein